MFDDTKAFCLRRILLFFTTLSSSHGLCNSNTKQQERKNLDGKHVCVVKMRTKQECQHPNSIFIDRARREKIEKMKRRG